MSSTSLRHFFQSFAVFGALCTAAPAFAEPIVDLVAAGGIGFKTTLDDDVSNTTSQLVLIPIKNVGNVSWNTRRPSIRVSLNGRVTDGLIYGPRESYFALGAPIAPGQVGRISLKLPLGTLGHCQRVSLRIDLLQNQQVGLPYVFVNDVSSQLATQMGNIRACLVNPLPPLPIRP